MQFMQMASLAQPQPKVMASALFGPSCPSLPRRSPHSAMRERLSWAGLALLASSWLSLCLPVALGQAERSVLVLLGNDDLRQSHATFFADLEAAGYTLDVRGAKDADMRLQRYGVWQYANLILLAPRSSCAPLTLAFHMGREWWGTGHDRWREGRNAEADQGHRPCIRTIVCCADQLITNPSAQAGKFVGLACRQHLVYSNGHTGPPGHC